MSGNTTVLINVAIAAAMSFVLLLLLRPLLRRYALAHPNARSSHKIPTPQGAGAAVIAAMIVTVSGVSLLLGSDTPPRLVIAATLFLAIVGGADDLSPIPILPRLVLQAVAVAAAIAALPDELRVLPAFPFWIERVLLGIAILWFVNLTNFMDGIDWMTVAEVVPVTAGLALFGLAGALPRDATLAAAALCGAIAGFAPFNRPVASVFLGDVGSLPIGLLLGWLLASLAGNGHFAAALLLPLYYTADATITLFRRLAKGERIAQAHRGHFYQRAVDGKFSVRQVVGRVFVLNVALAALAVATLLTPLHLLHACALIAGCVLVGLLLYSFEAARV